MADRSFSDFFIFFMFVAIAAYLIFSLNINPDIAWHLIVIDRLLEGEALYKDIIDTQLPFIYYLHTPAALISKTFNIPLNVSTKLFSLIVTMLIAQLAIRMAYKTSTHHQTIHRNALAAALLFAIFILPILTSHTHNFGHPSHLATIALLPYILSNLALRESLSSNEKYCIALITAISLSIEPLYILTLIYTELFFAICLKEPRRIFRTETMLAILLWLLYLIVCALFFLKDFLEFTYPISLHIKLLYILSNGWHPDFAAIATFFYYHSFFVFPFLLVPFAYRGIKGNYYRIYSVGLFILLGLFLIIQESLLSQHFYVIFTFSILMLSDSVPSFIKETRKTKKWLNRQGIVLSVILCVMIFQSAPKYYEKWQTRNLESPILQYLTTYKNPLFFGSTTPFLATMVENNKAFTFPYRSLWPYEQLDNYQHSPNNTQQITDTAFAIEKKIMQDIITYLTHHNSQMIVIQTSANQHYKYIETFSDNKTFQTIWDSFYKVGATTIATGYNDQLFDVYLRKNASALR